MKITNTRLRQIIREEAIKLKSTRRLNENTNTIYLSYLDGDMPPIPSSKSEIGEIFIKIDGSPKVMNPIIRSIDKSLSKFQSIGTLRFQSLASQSREFDRKGLSNILKVLESVGKNNLAKVTEFAYSIYNFTDVASFKSYLVKRIARPVVDDSDDDWLDTDLAMILDGDDHPLQNVYKPDPIDITVEDLLTPAIEEYSMDSSTANAFRIPYYDNDGALFKTFVSRLKSLLAVAKKSDAKMVKDFFDMLQYDTLMNAIVYFFQQPKDADFTDDSPGFEKKLKIGKSNTTRLRKGYINDITSLIKELQSK